MDAPLDFISSRRRELRKHYQKEISFSAGTNIFPGVVKNISSRGACIGSRETSRIRKGLKIIVAIPFARKRGSLKRKAFVKWTGSDQFGIQFAKRQNDRKSYQKDVYVSAGSVVFPGIMENISLRGACVYATGNPTIEPGSVVIVAIPFTKKRGITKRKAIVKWAQGNQFGIQFI